MSRLRGDRRPLRPKKLSPLPEPSDHLGGFGCDHVTTVAVGSGSGGSGTKYITLHSAQATNSVRYGGRPRRAITIRSKFVEPQVHSVGGWPSISAAYWMDEQPCGG